MNRLPRVISQAAPSWARVVARRSMGGDAHHAVRKGPQPGEFGGFEPPHVAPVHKYIGEGFMVLTWLWLMYRFKQDGKVLFGLEYPWESHGDPYEDDFRAAPRDALAEARERFE